MVKGTTEEAEAMICGRANFNGSLLSITWETARSALFVFADGKAVTVPTAGLTFRNWTTYFNGAVGWAELVNTPRLLEVDRRAPLLSYYILTAEGASHPIYLFSNSAQMVVARMNLFGLTLLSDYIFYQASSSSVTVPFYHGLDDDQFAIVHDQSGKDVHGWFIELNFKEQGNRAILSVYNLWLDEEKNFRMNFKAKLDYCHYALLSGGYFRLSDDIEALKKFESEKTTVQWSKHQYDGRPPRGFVDYRTGTLYLVDDRKGCVYSVLNWGRPDLGSTGRLPRVRNYMAFGTPFEAFFSCLHVKPAKLGKPGKADRCDLGGDSETYRQKGYGPGRSTPLFDWDDVDSRNGGKGGGGGGGGRLLMIFLSVGGALLLLLLVIGLYRKGYCCSKKEKSKTVSGKSSKTAKSGKFKSSATSNSSKMMVASKGGAGGGKAMPKSSVGGTSSAAGKSSVSSAAAPSDYFPSSSAASSSSSVSKSSNI